MSRTPTTEPNPLGHHKSDTALKKAHMRTDKLPKGRDAHSLSNASGLYRSWVRKRRLDGQKILGRITLNQKTSTRLSAAFEQANTSWGVWKGSDMTNKKEGKGKGVSDGPPRSILGRGHGGSRGEDRICGAMSERPLRGGWAIERGDGGGRVVDRALRKIVMFQR